jgi:hypothetical protein
MFPRPARVQLLLALCGPAAVGRLVVAVVVDAVNRMAWRRLAAHVCQKVLVRLAPSVADSDPPASVSVKPVIMRVGAAHYHRAPRPKFSGDSTDSCVAMRRHPLAQLVLVEAPTAHGVAIAKAGAVNHALSSTIASAQPIRSTMKALGPRKNCIASESLSGCKHDSGHGHSPIIPEASLVSLS